jgi:hypothetical protein
MKQHYLEYERKGTLKALLYPCTEQGAAEKDKINNPSMFLHVSQSDNYVYKGIIQLDHKEKP